MSDLDIATVVIIIAFIVGGIFGAAIKINLMKKEKEGKILSKKKKRELENGN